jgi:hypothetical protein
MLSNADLAAVTGGNTCYVSNWSSTATAVTPRGGAATSLAPDATTRVPAGDFTVSQRGGSIDSTCKPGLGFVVSNPVTRNGSWGLGTVSNRGR